MQIHAREPQRTRAEPTTRARRPAIRRTTKPPRATTTDAERRPVLVEGALDAPVGEGAQQTLVHLLRGPGRAGRQPAQWGSLAVLRGHSLPNRFGLLSPHLR